ncbi:nucleoside/nucleotide kinase family protein [Nocardioides guangzhouensis]|uniref:Nucleoside/nucleotide kinase family protein n=1 Tax=Nocardioides guangzhouensis TaxID=2497878 RepID=A0A4Q4ZFF2_9ACTN|nr:nucleoside/nucleotide kinase family protein [Nocardioides guangzhouensis]RYP86890.1 nucleoside/nucleotide kinase family protein [Nocardioides guangzhouensis]
MTPSDVPSTVSLGPAGAELAGLVPAVGERRFLLGVTGAPGAGKSTLATHLAVACGATVVPMDGFHLADVELVRRGIRDRKGAPETFDGWGYAALLARVRDRPPYVVLAPGFERGLEQPIAGAVPVLPTAGLVVTEGNYLLLDDPEWRAVRSTLDAVWHVRTDDAVRRERLVARHVRFGKSPDAARAWVDRVDEPNARLVEAAAHRADLVLDLTDWVP